MLSPKHAVATRVSRAAGLCLVAVYGLSLFFPPDSAYLVPPEFTAGVTARLFPMVPAWWILARLACLGLGVVLLLLASKGFAGFEGVDAQRFARGAPAPELDGRSAIVGRSAVAAAALLVVAGFFLETLGRPLQFAYIASLAIPAVLYAIADVRPSFTPATKDRFPLFATGAVILLWLAARILALDDNLARSANAVDMWEGLVCFRRAAGEGFHLLSGGCASGYTALPTTPYGVGILGVDGIPLNLKLVLQIQTVWLAIVATGVAWLAARWVSRISAPIAAAAFLFAPFVLARTLESPSFVFSLYTVALFSLAISAAERGDRWRIAALGAVAGIGACCPNLVLVAPTALATFAWIGHRRGTAASTHALVTAALLFVAALVPGRAEILRVVEMVTSWSDASLSWAVLEGGLGGQISPFLAEGAAVAGTAGSGDIALSLALAPLATPRTPMRFWGDSLFDPIAQILLVVGIVATAVGLRRSFGARMIALLFVATFLPGIASTYDRPHLTRVSAAAIPLALFVAAGFRALTANLSVRTARLAAGVASIAVAVSGTLLFDSINPRILPASAPGVALEAFGDDDSGDDPATALFSDRMTWDESYTRMMIEELASPGRIEAVSPGEIATGLENRAETVVAFWSPGEETDYAISEKVCTRADDVRFFTLSDRTRTRNVFAATRSSSWQPALAAARVRESGCTDTLDTEAVRSAIAINRYATIVRSGGSPREAEARLRDELRRTIASPVLLDALARSLTADGRADTARHQEALWLATRACNTARGTAPDACIFAATLAAQSPEAIVNP